MDSNVLASELKAMSARQLMRWLATPAKCGFYLSADDIRRLGAQLAVGVSPFGRANGLEQLLRSAALDNRLAQALELLKKEMSAQIEQYRALELAALEGWIERGNATVEAWTEIATTFSDEDASGRST